MIKKLDKLSILEMYISLIFLTAKSNLKNLFQNYFPDLSSTNQLGQAYSSTKNKEVRSEFLIFLDDPPIIRCCHVPLRILTKEEISMACNLECS